MSTRWSALDDCKCKHENTTQDAIQVSDTVQVSEEFIHIKDSCNIDIKSTDTQVAVSLQAAIQVAIALVINLTIADSSRAEQVTQDLLQNSVIRQANKQKVFIENSRDVKITTSDTDVAISLQVLIQILLALLVSIDIL